jgi:hypothetical protein
MVSEEKQYEFVSEQVRYFNEKIIESFNFFIKVFSAVAGGSIWLSMQKDYAGKFSSYLTLSNSIVVLITVIAVIRVIENLRAWHGYRNAQCRLDFRIPTPRPFRASVLEALMVVGMITAAVLFWVYNPFASYIASHQNPKGCCEVVFRAKIATHAATPATTFATSSWPPGG